MSLSYLHNKILIDTTTNTYYRVGWISKYVTKKKNHCVQGRLDPMKSGIPIHLHEYNYGDFCIRFQQADPFITEVLFGKAGNPTEG